MKEQEIIQAWNDWVTSFEFGTEHAGITLSNAFEAGYKKGRKTGGK